MNSPQIETSEKLNQQFTGVYRKKPTGHRHLPISGPFQNRLRASVAVPLCGDVPVPGLAKIATPKSPVTKVCPG